MPTALLLTTALTALLLGLGAGVHVAGVAALNPAWRSLPAADYVRTKQAADRTFPQLMRPLTLAGIVGSAAATVLGVLADRPAVATAAGVGLVAATVGLWAVLAGDLPVNRAMATWDPDAPPADWQDVRAGWERWFAVRTAATLLAAVALVTALALVP